MLVRSRFHDPIRRGEVTMTVRRWKRPQAKIGGVYRLHTGGAIEATAVEVVEASQLTEADALASGYDSMARLLAHTEGREGDLYRIRFRYVGEVADPRAELAQDGDLDGEAVREVAERLDRMDRGKAWTRETLRLIEANEGVRAADLAQRMGRETLRFKTDVRRLKALGLTESLEVGYRLSPRGRAFLGADAAAAGGDAS